MKTSVVICILFLMNQGLFAQDFNQLLKTGKEDLSTYSRLYFQPILSTVSNGFAGGWYNTAKPHKQFGFDITLSLNTVEIPTTFIFKNSDYKNLKLNSGATTSTQPNLFGVASSNEQLEIPVGSSITVDGQTVSFNTSSVFDAPGGLLDLEDLPVNRLPVPTINLGFGVFKETDLKVRYIPTLSVGDEGKFNLLGIGVLHSINQWVPSSNLPLDLSFMLGYTKMNFEYDIDYTDSELTGNGEITTSISSSIIQVVASKKYLFATPYIGLGYQIASSNFNINGTYTYAVSGQTLVLKDPVQIESEGLSSMRLNFGLRIKLAFLSFHGEYAIQQSNLLTVGFGISIRD